MQKGIFVKNHPANKRKKVKTTCSINQIDSREVV